MAEQVPNPVPGSTEEAQQSHKKKAQYVVVALVGIVVVGLVLQSYFNMHKREKRLTDSQEAAEKADAAAGELRPEAKLADFAKAQKAAGNQAEIQQKASAEEAARKKLTEAMAAAQAGVNAEGSDEGAATGTSDGAGGQNSIKSIEASAQLDERKRVLAAMSAGLGRATAKAAGGARGQPSNQGELAKVNERIEALSAVPAALEARKRQLIEGAAAAGISLSPNALADQSGQSAAAQFQQSRLQQVAAPAAAPMGEKVFGELATTRAARDPVNAGPQPGEEVLPTGSVVSAVLDMDMISDYLGNWIAVLQRPVYDPTLEFVLLPAGTKITGKSIRATGVNENIANRMGAVPLWAIRPDGKRIDFRKTGSMDAAGVGALKDQVDRHFLAQFMGVSAYALIGLGPSFGSYGAEPNTSRDQFAREFTSKGRDAGRTFAEKFLNIVPTQTIRAGTPMKIFIEDDIYIKPWERADAPHYNRR